MPRVSRIVAYPLLGACGYGALYYWAGRSVYYPMRFPHGLWDAQAPLGAQDVWLTTRDGVRLHGWWLPAAGARFVTVFLHGNAGNVTHRAMHLRELAGAGSSVLALDYRGYGKSGGRPTERGLYADAEAAYEHVRAFGKPVILHGESLGTAVAVELAARRPCAGLVLESPFTSAREMAGRVLPVIGPLLIFGFDSARKIAAVRAPLLVIHGERDSIVPIDLGRKLFSLAREPKSFWAVPAADHNNLVETAGAAYRARLRQFYDSLR